MSGLLTLGALDPAVTDWVGLAAILLGGLVVAWVSGVLYARRSLRNPPRRTYGTAVARNQPGTPAELDAARFGSGPRVFEEWTLDRPSGKGTLPVWEIAGDDPSGPTVVFTHGWGDGRIGGLLRLEPFLSSASRILLWDLPGHGDAPASAGPCELGRVEAEDLRALLAKTDGPVVLFGWSLGAGVSIVAAADEPRVAGVVLEAPYCLPQIPASRVMGARGLPRVGMLRAALMSIGGSAWLREGGPFDRAAAAAKVRAPMLVLQGSQDPVCPPEGAESIARSAGASAEVASIVGGRHNDLWINPRFRAECCSAVAAWLASPRSASARARPADRTL